MNANAVHCEECVEDIPNDEIYWEEERIHCRRCGSELEIPAGASDLFDTIVGKKAKPLYSFEDDEDDEPEDEDKQGHDEQEEEDAR